MRDMLEALDGQDNPIELARRAVKPQLRRRFYEQVDGEERPEGFVLTLDGKPVRTPARALLALPSRALAERLAAEWQAQTEFVDPSRMPLTRLANTIIDGVAAAAAAVAEEVAKYAGSDLLFYRAEGPEELIRRQAQHWDPVLAWARERLGSRFVLSEGVMFVPQAPEAVATVREVIPQDPWRLGAVHAATTLTGSALLALALLHDVLDTDAAWAAAHVDEDWNAEQWGRDALAEERRAFRRAEMDAAVTIMREVA